MAAGSAAERIGFDSPLKRIPVGGFDQDEVHDGGEAPPHWVLRYGHRLAEPCFLLWNSGEESYEERSEAVVLALAEERATGGLIGNAYADRVIIDLARRRVPELDQEGPYMARATTHSSESS